MTKKEREITQNFINKISDINAEKGRAFKELQELNAKEGSGNRWCCAATNYQDLLKAGHDYTTIFERYVSADSMLILINKFGQELADIGFWK